MRSAGCCVNDVADRDFDRHVKRTAQRPVTSGAVSVREALTLGAALALVAFALVLTTNPPTVWLSLAGLAVTLVYPFAKRVTSRCRRWCSASRSASASRWRLPPCSAARTGRCMRSPMRCRRMAWWLLLGNIFWVLAYDTEYAMVDRDDDLQHRHEDLGHHARAASTWPRVMAFYAIYLLSLVGARCALGLGGWFQLGIAAAAAQALWHYTLIRDAHARGLLRGFRLNHWLGAACSRAWRWIWRCATGLGAAGAPNSSPSVRARSRAACRAARKQPSRHRCRATSARRRWCHPWR